MLRLPPYFLLISHPLYTINLFFVSQNSHPFPKQFKTKEPVSQFVVKHFYGKLWHFLYLPFIILIYSNRGQLYDTIFNDSL